MGTDWLEWPFMAPPNRSASKGAAAVCGCFVEVPVNAAALALPAVAPKDSPPNMSALPAALLPAGWAVLSPPKRSSGAAPALVSL